MKISLPTPKVHGVPYHLWNPYTPMKKFLPFLKFGPVVTVKGEGNFVVNSRGSKYINGYSGMWSFALGYDRDELVEAASRQMKELPFASLWGLSHPPAIKLAAKLVEISGGHYNRYTLDRTAQKWLKRLLKLLANTTARARILAIEADTKSCPCAELITATASAGLPQWGTQNSLKNSGRFSQVC